MNDKTIIELGYHKIAWLVSVSLSVNDLPLPSLTDSAVNIVKYYKIINQSASEKLYIHLWTS
jgi:hypothetical protein